MREELDVPETRGKSHDLYAPNQRPHEVVGVQNQII